MHSKEIKQEVLKLIEEGKSIKSISDIYSISISISTISKWKKENIEEKNLIIEISKKIFKLIENNELEAAIELYQTYEEELKKEFNIQKQIIEILIRLSRYAEALEIIENSEFKPCIPFQKIKKRILYSIDNLVFKNQLKEALKICSLPQFENNVSVQEKKINILIKLSRYEEALEIANREELKDFSFIQNLKIDIIKTMEIESKIQELIDSSQYELVFEIIEQSNFNTCVSIKKIRKKLLFLADQLINENKLIEALKICSLPQFANNYYAQEKRIIILTKLSRYEEALEIANREELKDFSFIQNLKKDIIEKMNTIDTTKDNLESNHNDINCEDIEVNKLFTRIYLDDISLNEINNSNIEEFKKLILIILYYEKYKISGISKIIKEAKNKYKNDSEKIRVLNKLCNRFESKNIPFLNYMMYSSILNCQLCQDMIYEHNAKKENHKPIKLDNKTVDKVENTIQKKEKITNKNITHKPTSIKHSKVILQDKKEPKVKQSVDISNFTIEDVFSKEVLEIKSIIYVKMNETASKEMAEVWDRFCILIEKSITDKSALCRFVEFATYISTIGTYTSINIDSLNSKKLKYIKPNN